MNEEHAEAFIAEKAAAHKKWLETPLDPNGWLDLLMRCQNGQATCLYVLEKIQSESRSSAELEVLSWAQALLTALNVGDVQSGSLIHLKLREVMIAYRNSKEPR